MSAVEESNGLPVQRNDHAARGQACSSQQAINSPPTRVHQLGATPRCPGYGGKLKTIVQSCIVHLLRNSFRYASRADWAAIAKDLKPVYTAPSEQAALDRFAEFSDTWETRYPAIVRLWTNAWAEFVPFLAFDSEIRTIICTTNAIESINARIRRAVNARAHRPSRAHMRLPRADEPGTRLAPGGNAVQAAGRSR